VIFFFSSLTFSLREISANDGISLALACRSQRRRVASELFGWPRRYRLSVALISRKEKFVSVLTNDNGEAKPNNSGATLFLWLLRARAREIPF
jgi:hypothetical protein